ncbi:bifunctional methylenetetrahydrofolate dehydrogenase/methenyltetrahydrofolate cyclohydrolase FolD [Buchnera aphidicola (Thelaxes californica)]|uniref:Bifunctional protein FolD n=1 Tax=Buchnera aphidicola (Thelaxes californica) TaxID=1315998 RepID=A0A4D6YP47_9GAMM|nr:bifunctional methylenetetrahydrofolate dehydrogenase/methenyltetrahydrofolate cyclohydrolase FolD [Buchnera aphidicola]QCI26895.1 bifunctional methylenetetrahydrofolate dehydrogenase/methenyltetrahydrofolate cyclohydrolase FolD [Buchnera aphidicola (Thelaxes californica)]
MLKKIINGNIISLEIRNKIKIKVKQKIREGHRPPGLAVILIGNNTSSKIYIENKTKACQQIGILSKNWFLPENTSETELLNLIKQLNTDTSIDGILVQLPFPKSINPQNIFSSIHPKKDVDGFHPYNIGCLFQKTPKLRPCTPKGIMLLLQYFNIHMHGMHAVILGASNIVGRPMCMELLLAGCTTTVTHRFTKNISHHINQADILVVAIGQSNFVKGEWLKKGVIVIDAGINQLQDGTITGDVDFNSALEKCSLITPVPGGVGPMTITALLLNTIESYESNVI